jgi:D-aminoacyl-tRNA deacylase
MSEKVVLFYSGDMAGKNIAEILKGGNPWAKVVESEREILYLEDLDIKPEICIVASRHKSEAGIPVLTAHSPGNFGRADFGGNDGELSIAPALYLRNALEYLKYEKEKKKLPYEISLEASHHGPTSLKFPIMFVEVGSSEEQWKDMDACGAVAKVILKLVESEPEEVPTAIAFGGGHYCRKFSSLGEYAIGHICPKHNLPNLDELMICQMITKTIPKPEIALVEKKGMGKEKGRVLELVEKTELQIVKV